MRRSTNQYLSYFIGRLIERPWRSLVVLVVYMRLRLRTVLAMTPCRFGMIHVRVLSTIKVILVGPIPKWTASLF